MLADRGTALHVPTIEEIRQTRRAIDAHIVTTPVWRWQGREVEERLGSDGEVWLKLELLQKTGTFKIRGAVHNLAALDIRALERGVTAVSAGNHAIAVAFAARLFGTTARLVMPRSAPAFRVEKVRAYGGDVVLVDDVHLAFAEVARIEREEGRTFIHPYEGEMTILGQATLGLELAEQQPDLEAVVIPIGGGGLAAGMATAIKQILPRCAVYGVEPRGADSMSRSLHAGSPQSIDRVETIADSLGAPRAEPYSFHLCRRFVDDIVLVSDEEIKAAMGLLFTGVKLACEPACAASTAAALGPLSARLRGKRVALVACGSNIGIDTFCAQIRSEELE